LVGQAFTAGMEARWLVEVMTSMSWGVLAR